MSIMKFRWSAVCVAMLTANIGGATITSPNGKYIVPPVVWQYSALLPASDYLKPAHVHSANSASQERPWQDVQRNFYDGLRVEGASETAASIAYAGVYAFAPRWPLVELIEVDDPGSEYPGTRLYTVQSSKVPANKMTVEEYRSLSLQILLEGMSLADIQSAIDTRDAKSNNSQLAPLGGIGEPLDRSDDLVNTDGFDSGGLDSVGGVKVVGVNSEAIKTVADSLATTAPANEVSEPATSIDTVVVPGIDEVSGNGQVGAESKNIFYGEQFRSADSVESRAQAADPDSVKVATQQGEIVVIEPVINVVLDGAEEVDFEVLDTEEIDDEWLILPDGTVVLRDVGREANQ